MKYRILVIFFLIIVADKAYAFENGLLQGKKPTTSAYYSYDLDKITDNDLTTYGYIHKVYFTGTFYFDLADEKTITSVFLKMNKDNGLNYKISFKDKNNNTLKVLDISDTGDGNKTISRNGFTSILPINYTKKIEISFTAVQPPVDHIKIYEFDVFDSPAPDKEPPSEVVDVRFLPTENAISTFFNTPNDVDFAGTKLYLNGILKATLDKTKTSYTFTNLQPNTTYAVKVVSFDTSNNNSRGVTTTVKTLPPPDVTNLELFSSTYSILAQWINPADSGFIGNDLYLNGNFITSLDKDATSYKFTNLDPNTIYTVKVVSKFSGGYSSTGQTATAKTTIPLAEDVTDLQADAKYDRVKLSWTRPESEFFSHVNIYRKKVEEQSFFDQLFGSSSVSAATTSDGYTPMFETNGTYWTDLTVDPDTTYSYKVTSENIEGKESEGVTIEATTPPEPLPTMNGVSTRQDENGDYVVTWTSPTTGKVKVLIDGNEYATIDAATQKIIIPKEDMKLNFFGGYDARLVPISEKGTEGKPVQVPVVGETKVNPPFSFEEFMQTVISLLAWAAPFILLSFVLIFWRPIVEFIKKTLANAKGGRVKQ